MILFPYYKYLYVLNPDNKPFSINFFEKGSLSFSEKFIRVDVSNVDYLDLVLTDSSQSYNFLDVFIEYNDYKDINYNILGFEFFNSSSNPANNKPFTVSYIYNKVYYKKSVPILSAGGDNTAVFILRNGSLLCVRQSSLLPFDYVLCHIKFVPSVLSLSYFYIKDFYSLNTTVSGSTLFGKTKPSYNNYGFTSLFDYKNIDLININMISDKNGIINFGCYFSGVDYYIGQYPVNYTTFIQIPVFDNNLAYYVYSNVGFTLRFFYSFKLKSYLYV